FSFGAAAPASVGFSFGGAAAPAASTPGGFGFGAAPAPAAAPAAGGFGFGTAAPAPAAAPASGGFGFGAAPAAAAPAAGGFGFGAPATTPASSGFGFGGSATPAASGFGFGGLGTPQPTGFGGGFGSAAAPAQQPVYTAFEALPPDVQRNMTQFHAFLKRQEQADAFLRTVSPRQLEALRANMARLEQDALARRNRQDRQAAAVQRVRQDVRQLLHQVDAATLSRRSLESERGSLFHVLRRVEMPSPYYWELLGHYEREMAAVKAQIEDVEAAFKPLFDGAAAPAPVPAQLQQLLLAQNAALMQAAARVADAHEKAEETRQLFLARMQADLARHGEQSPAAFQNPFDKRKRSGEADKRQAIDKIRFRTSVAPSIVPPTAPAAPAAAAPAAFGFASAPAASSGFGFGTPPAPAKTVSFSLGGSGAAPGATSVAAAPLAAAPGGGFAAPTVATGGFGSISSSFLPPAAADKKTAGSKRGGRAQKKRL
ncbi:hypothetical protein BBJ28_00014442, partial [Nothophytophthora sp. Chile5]